MCCVALPCCLLDLACFFLPSFFISPSSFPLFSLLSATDACPPHVRMTLTHIKSGGQLLTTTATPTSHHSASFTFTSVLPGTADGQSTQYIYHVHVHEHVHIQMNVLKKIMNFCTVCVCVYIIIMKQYLFPTFKINVFCTVSLHYPMWCWEVETVPVVMDPDLTPTLHYVQTGYAMEYSTSHDITVLVRGSMEHLSFTACTCNALCVCVCVCVVCRLHWTMRLEWSMHCRKALAESVSVHQVQCTVYSVQCTRYSVQCMCTVHQVQCTVYVYSAPGTVYSVQCMCTVHQVELVLVYSVCTVYSVVSKSCRTALSSSMLCSIPTLTGLYSITPKSCHKFEMEQYGFDT